MNNTVLITLLWIVCTVGVAIGFHGLSERDKALKELSAEYVRFEELDHEAGLMSDTLEQLLGFRKIEKVHDVVVMMRAYTARPQETDSRPFETACGTLTVPWTIALTQDIWDDYEVECGDIVILPGIGPFSVTDFKPGGYRGADLLFPSVDTALIFGVNRGMITIVKGAK